MKQIIAVIGNANIESDIKMYSDLSITLFIILPVFYLFVFTLVAFVLLFITCVTSANVTIPDRFTSAM